MISGNAVRFFGFDSKHKYSRDVSGLSCSVGYVWARGVKWDLRQKPMFILESTVFSDA